MAVEKLERGESLQVQTFHTEDLKEETLAASEKLAPSINDLMIRFMLLCQKAYELDRKWELESRKESRSYSKKGIQQIFNSSYFSGAIACANLSVSCANLLIDNPKNASDIIERFGKLGDKYFDAEKERYNLEGKLYEQHGSDAQEARRRAINLLEQAERLMQEASRLRSDATRMH